MTRAKPIEVNWIDFGREPQCAPDPAFPNGKDVDLTSGEKAVCLVDLPYPAKRCGLFMVGCKTCGLNVGITTAGRPDDPKTVKLGCLLAANNNAKLKSA